MIPRAKAQEKVELALAENGLDALVAVSPWNVCYTAGTSFMTQRTIPERLALTVSTPGQETVFIYCAIEDGHAREESWLTDLRGYVEFADRPMQLLADVLRENGAASGRIGIEKNFLVAKDFEELSERLPDADLVAADAIFDRMRAIKTAEEIEVLSQAALITDAAILAAFEAASVGDTERSIADQMVAEARARGGGDIVHLVLASGPNALKAHHTPTNRRIERGEVVRTDFGMIWGHYLSDIARTALVAPARPEQLDTYRNLDDAQLEVLAAVEPGLRIGDLYVRCAQAFEQRGLDFRMPHIGHSIGIGLHENPMIHPGNEELLEPGMVLMIEPLAVAPDGYYHTEDMVEVTDTGRRILSRSTDWSEPVIIS